MTVYDLLDQVPLTFQRIRNGAPVSGLSVTVSVKNAQTGASLLASTSCPEKSATGIYTYMWTHGLTDPTECMVSYLVGGAQHTEMILISNGSNGSSAV